MTARGQGLPKLPTPRQSYVAGVARSACCSTLIDGYSHIYCAVSTRVPSLFYMALNPVYRKLHVACFTWPSTLCRELHLACFTWPFTLCRELHLACFTWPFTLCRELHLPCFTWPLTLCGELHLAWFTWPFILCRELHLACFT